MVLFLLLPCKASSRPERLWAQGADSPAGSAAVTYIGSPLGLGCGGRSFQIGTWESGTGLPMMTAGGVAAKVALGICEAGGATRPNSHSSSMALVDASEDSPPTNAKVLLSSEPLW